MGCFVLSEGGEISLGRRSLLGDWAVWISTIPELFLYL